MYIHHNNDCWSNMVKAKQIELGENRSKLASWLKDEPIKLTPTLQEMRYILKAFYIDIPSGLLGTIYNCLEQDGFAKQK